MFHEAVKGGPRNNRPRKLIHRGLARRPVSSSCYPNIVSPHSCQRRPLGDSSIHAGLIITE